MKKKLIKIKIHQIFSGFSFYFFIILILKHILLSWQECWFWPKLVYWTLYKVKIVFDILQKRGNPKKSSLWKDVKTGVLVLVAAVEEDNFFYCCYMLLLEDTCYIKKNRKRNLLQRFLFSVLFFISMQKNSQLFHFPKSLENGPTGLLRWLWISIGVIKVTLFSFL